MSAQKTRGEVFTPMDLINEMLDKLPNEVWDDPTLKWLEPSAGNGRFVKAVYDRLMLTIKDEKHILENMLYMAELDANNCETIRNTYDTKYKLNLFEGDYTEYTTDIQFDIIYGNPPYQKVYLKTGKRIGGASLWSVFINNSIKILKDDGYLLFITPCSWASGGSNKQSGNILNGVMKKYTIYHLNIQECSKHFKKVKSTFSYYLIKKSFEDKDFDCVCAYKKQIYTSQISNNNFRKLRTIPILLNNTMINIIDKMESITPPKLDFKRVRDLDRDSKINRYDENGKYNVKHKVVEIYKTNYKQECMGKDKVIISMCGYIKAEYDKECGCSDATLFMYVKNKEESKKVINLLNSKPYKMIINNYRQLTGFNNHENINKLPLIDIKTNENIYKYFNLTEEEINLIEDNI